MVKYRCDLETHLCYVITSLSSNFSFNELKKKIKCIHLKGRVIEIFYRHNQGISYNFIWVFHGWPEPRCNRKLDWQAHAAIDPRPSDVRCSFPSGSLTCCITTPPQTLWSSRHYPKADRNKPQVLQANDKAAFVCSTLSFLIVRASKY